LELRADLGKKFFYPSPAQRARNMDAGSTRVRLGLMMFGQYLILGAWAVPLSTYLLTPPDRGGLGFSPEQTSWIYSTTALASLVAPLMVGLLADRLFATQKLLGFVHLGGASIFVLAAGYCTRRQEELRVATDAGAATDATFAVLMAMMFVVSFVTVLSLALCNVTGFRNLREPKKTFGSIRLFGTVAWIAVNVGLDMFGTALSAQPLYIAAGGSLAMGLYSFTLPHTPPARLGKGVGEALGLPALKMFRNSSFRILVVSALCMAAVQQFYGVYANPFLSDLGSAKPTALQSLAQVSELVCLLAFPFVLARYGFKVTLAIGVFGWVLRNAIFATGWLPLIAAVGLPMHGMCFTFFFVVCNVYVDRHAPQHLRASAQGILTFTVAGIGTLLGNVLSGRAREAIQSDGAAGWTWFWLVPAAAAAVVFLLFVVGFHEESPSHSRKPKSEGARSNPATV
jgi:nucleoside transporter